MRQIEQEGGDPPLRRHRAEQKHHGLIAHDLTAQRPVKFALQIGGLAQPGTQFCIVNAADHRVLERDSAKAMTSGRNAVQPEQFVAHLEARDLIVTALVGVAGLELTGPDLVERLEAIALTNQQLTARDAALPEAACVQAGEKAPLVRP